MNNMQTTTSAGLQRKQSFAEKHKDSSLFKGLIKISKWLAILILILNIILPGVGTMILGCCLPDGEERAQSCYGMFLMGLYQLILTPCLIGWIWSILFGVLLVAISCDNNNYEVPI